MITQLEKEKSGLQELIVGLEGLYGVDKSDAVFIRDGKLITMDDHGSHRGEIETVQRTATTKDADINAVIGIVKEDIKYLDERIRQIEIKNAQDTLRRHGVSEDSPKPNCPGFVTETCNMCAKMGVDHFGYSSTGGTGCAIQDGCVQDSEWQCDGSGNLFKKIT